MRKETSIRARRSLIFAPGDKPQMFAKAVNAGADMVTIDLEDAVAPHHKRDARREALAFFASMRSEPGASPERVLRINCLRTPEGLADLQAVVEADTPPTALMLPKVKSPAEIRVHEELLAESPHAAVRFHVIIETNEALESCVDIARSSSRIDSLLFGGVDMAAELRVVPTWEALLYARSRLVHAAASAGVDLIDVPYMHLDDMSGMEREATDCATLGMTGKAAIHPRQVPILNRCFSPTSGAVEQARRIVRAFEQGAGGLLVVDNKLIEKPVLRSMYRILAIADKLAESPDTPS